VVRGVKTGRIFGRLTAQHGANCKKQRSVYEWVERLKGGLTNDDDDARSGRPPKGVDRSEYPRQPKKRH